MTLPSGNLNSLPEDEQFDIYLGEVLFRAGLLTQAQLTQAMWEKPETGLRLEEICIEHGWLSPEKLYPFIPSHMLRLGQILLLYGYLTLDQLRYALVQQNRQPHRKLGEVLVDQGWLGSDVLFWMIEEQEELRRLAAPNTWEIVQARPRKPITSSNGSTLVGIPPMRPSSSNPQTLERQVEIYRNTIQKLEAHIQEKRQEWDQIHAADQEEIADLKRQLQAISEQPSASGAQESSVQEQELQQTITQLQQQLQESQIALQGQQWLNQQLTNEVTDHKQKIRELEQQQRDLEAQLREAHYQQTQLQASLSQGQLQNPNLAGVQQNITYLQQQLQQAQAELQQQQWLNQQFQTQQYQDQQQLQAWEAYQVQVEQEMQRLHQEIETISQQAQDHWQTLQQYQTQVQDKQTQVEKVQATKARLISDLAEARRQSMDFQYQLQLQQQAAQEQAEQIARLETQLSQEKQKNVSLLRQAQEQQSTHLHRIQTLQERLKQQLQPDPTGTAQSGLQQRKTVDLTDPPASPPSLWGSLSISPDGQVLGLDESSPLAKATPWVQRVLVHLRLAALISETDINKILAAWDKEGGTFTDVLRRYTGLKAETIKFFSEEGYSVKVKGSRKLRDYLAAAGIVSPDQIQSAQKRVQPGQSLSQALVDQGVLKPGTREYFVKAFGHSVGGGDPRTRK